MFCAFVAKIDDENTICVRGNGKTCSMTFYLYLCHKKGYTVWTNYYTTFSDEVIGFQEMITKLREMKQNKKETNIILGVTEMQELINSVGSDKNQTLFVDSFANQMRKLDVDCYYDTQILKHIHKRLRRHTENIRIPIKKHLDEEQCNYDRCTKKHIIDIYSYEPFKELPVRRIAAWKVGQMYNTSDIVIDKIILPKGDESGNKPKS